MQRGSDDIAWQKVKKRIALRDRDSCQLLSILSLKESLQLHKLAIEHHKQRSIYYLDPAHIFSVKLYKHLIYEPLNIITLNRFAHDLLDNNRSPLSGKSITKEERSIFFERILGKNKFALLSEWAKYPERYHRRKSYHE